MKKAMTLVLASFLLMPALALASGSSGGGSAPAGTSSVDPYKVTETMKCIVTDVREDGTVLVREKGQPEHPLALNYKTKITPQDKAAFDGRKKLERGDFQVGQTLKVTHRPATGEVLRVKILKAT